MNRFLFILLLFSGRLPAFTVMDAAESRFVDSEVAIDVSSNDCSAIGMTPEEVLNLAEEAVDKYWNRIPHCSLELVRGQVVETPVDIDIASDDPDRRLALQGLFDNIGNNRILLGCNAESFNAESGRTLGLGLIYNNRGLVFINAGENNLFQAISREQRLAVLAHEIGHAFGLGHSADPVALMYYDISGKIQKKLNADDFDGCAYLYPQQFPGSCSMVPYLSGEDDSSGGGGGVRQVMVMGLFLGFVFAAMLTGGVARLWKD